MIPIYFAYERVQLLLLIYSKPVGASEDKSYDGKLMIAASRTADWGKIHLVSEVQQWKSSHRTGTA